MTTVESRRARIAEALKAWNSKPDNAKETLPIHWRTRQELFPVLELPIDTVLLNARSHRLRAQLEAHPSAEGVRNDPWSDTSQAILESLLHAAHRDFDRLKQSLLNEGQRQPGVVTREGMLVNANSRVAALRDVNDPGMRWIKVALLPEDAEPQELAQLELSLQMQEDLKDEYTLSNELLFIQDLSIQYLMSDQQIADALRWTQRSGAQDVAQRLRILRLIREMQALTDPPVPLTFFDRPGDGKLEQLKALEQKYSGLIVDDPRRAQQLRDSWLATALAGQSSVHQLRAVDEEFVETYLLPRLSEQDILNEEVEDLLSPTDGRSDEGAPSGVDELDPDSTTSSGDGPDLRPLMKVLLSSQPTVTLPSGTIVDQSQLRDAVAAAAKEAVNDARLDNRAENRLDAPLTHLREATTRIRKATASMTEVKGNPEFEQTRRGKFNYQLRQLNKVLRDLTDQEDSSGESPKRT